MRRFSMIVIVLAAVAVGSVYGQAAWKLRVGVVAGKTVGLAQSPMLPNYTNNDRVRAQMLANFLNSRKPPSATAPQIDAITINTLDWNGIVKEAREKGCEYLVVMDTYPVSRRVQEQTLPAAVDTWDQRYAATQMETLSGPGVAYTIINVSDGKPMPHMSDVTDARSVYENLSKAPHP